MDTSRLNKQYYGIPYWAWLVIGLFLASCILAGIKYIGTEEEKTQQEMMRDIDQDLVTRQRAEAEAMIMNAIADAWSIYKKNPDDHRAVTAFDGKCKQGSYATASYSITQAVLTRSKDPDGYDVSIICNPTAQAASPVGACYAYFRWRDDKTKLEWR
ncbi:MAG: hypothetical protein K8I27_01580 [Planctomycetes bacterium]|nr:hypothetical protein [Planctomycetota bacterium]